MEQAETIDKVAEIFRNMGAPPEQAKTMSAQLVKRAHQVASEQGISEVKALQELLQRIVEQKET